MSKPSDSGSSVREITEADLERLARLARLRIEPAERAAAAKALSDILAMMGELRVASVDEEDEGAPVQAWGETLRMRDDEPQQGYPPETLLEAAPRAADGCFVVPKVIE